MPLQETKIFLIVYFSALLGVVPPGLVNMSVAKTCVKRGTRDGIYFAAGASFVVLLQALLAVVLARYIFDNPLVRNTLLRAAIVIFIILAVYFFAMGKRKKKEVEVTPASGLINVLRGMMVGMLNIFPIPFFVALAAALNLNGNVEYDISGNSAFVLGASLGTFTTLYCYALFFGRIDSKSELFARYSNYFMAGLMLVLVIITFLRIFYQ